MAKILKLGEDHQLAGGLAAEAQIQDESVGGQESTVYTFRLTNNTNVPLLQNIDVYITRIAGSLVPNPNRLRIATIRKNETEEVDFLVVNSTSSVQTNYRFRNRIVYFGGALTHTYDDFQSP